MGYDHYLWRPPELDLERWREWVGDVRQIISNLPPSVTKTYYPLDGPPVTVRAPAHRDRADRERGTAATE